MIFFKAFFRRFHLYAINLIGFQPIHNNTDHVFIELLSFRVREHQFRWDCDSQITEFAFNQLENYPNVNQ